MFVLPGILGSNLKVDGKRIWLGWRLVNGLKRLAYTPGKADGVEPDGPIGSTTTTLPSTSRKTHEVIEFAFDWRKPIEDEARRLADAVDAALDARKRERPAGAHPRALDGRPGRAHDAARAAERSGSA